MDRSRLIVLLSRKMAGEASSAELAELASLINFYPESIYYVELLAQLWHEIPAEEKPDTETLFQNHIRTYASDFRQIDIPLVVAETEQGAKRRSGLFIPMSIVILFLCCGLFYFKNAFISSKDLLIVAGKGIRKNIQLPDGTLVWLNSDSELSYANDIAKQGKRIVKLKGEAFFDVAHRTGQSFIVQTDRLSIKVLGTAFNVKDYALEQKSETTLMRGSIELSLNERSQQKILLNPSEKFAVVETSRSKSIDGKVPGSSDMKMTIEHILPIQIGQNEYIEEISWKDNALVFNNETLEDLKPRLERWFNIRISIQSDRAKGYRFTGAFKKEDIREAISALQFIKPFTYKFKENDLIIY